VLDQALVEEAVELPAHRPAVRRRAERVAVEAGELVGVGAARGIERYFDPLSGGASPPLIPQGLRGGAS